MVQETARLVLPAQVAKLVAGRRGHTCDRCAYEVIRIIETTSAAE